MYCLCPQKEKKNQSEDVSEIVFLIRGVQKTRFKYMGYPMKQSPERLNSMNYQEKLEEMTTRMGGKFIDYRPETGSWVFEVRSYLPVFLN